jgi:hypothetical protein
MGKQSIFPCAFRVWESWGGEDGGNRNCHVLGEMGKNGSCHVFSTKGGNGESGSCHVLSM